MSPRQLARTGTANLDTNPQREDRFVRAIVQELIFAAYLQIAEAICRAPFMWIQHDQGLADLDPQLRRDAFGDIHRDIGLARPAVIRRSYRADSWKRKFIGDKRIVG